MSGQNTGVCLTDEGIDRISEYAAGFLERIKTERRETLRIRLSVENVLLELQHRFGKQQEVTLYCSGRRRQICIKCSGEQFNPLQLQESGDGAWINNLRAGLRTEPVYEYAAGTNSVYFKIKRDRPKRLYATLICLALGIILGLLGQYVDPEVRSTVCENVFSPLYNAYLNIFSFVGIPLIFLSVFTGIIGVGSLRSFSQSGQKLVERYLLISFTAALITLLAVLPLFNLNFGGAGLDVEYGSLVSLVLGWLPSGLLQPLIDMNAVQLIIVGVVFAAAVLALKQTDSPLTQGLYDLNRVLLTMSSWLTLLIPFFVLVSVVNGIWQSDIEVLLQAWKSWVLTTGAQLIIILAMAGYISLKYRVGVPLLIKKISKTFLIALGTNSCSASVSENYSCCGSKLGLDPKAFSFGIPIGTTLFKPATAVRLVLLCIFMAESNQVAVSPGWLIMLVLLSLIFSIAIPAIPGGYAAYVPHAVRTAGHSRGGADTNAHHRCVL